NKVRDPRWADIEEAIRRLDRHRFPFLHLWPCADENTHDYDHDVFEIMGAEGAFCLQARFAGNFHGGFVYPKGGEEEVAVWTRDQGFAQAERHICRDIEAVLRAAHYYARHGGFDPSLSWERRG